MWLTTIHKLQKEITPTSQNVKIYFEKKNMYVEKCKKKFFQQTLDIAQASEFLSVKS